MQFSLLPTNFLYSATLPWCCGEWPFSLLPCLHYSICIPFVRLFIITGLCEKGREGWHSPFAVTMSPLHVPFYTCCSFCLPPMCLCSAVRGLLWGRMIRALCLHFLLLNLLLVSSLFLRAFYSIPTAAILPHCDFPGRRLTVSLGVTTPVPSSPPSPISWFLSPSPTCQTPPPAYHAHSGEAVWDLVQVEWVGVGYSGVEETTTYTLLFYYFFCSPFPLCVLVLYVSDIIQKTISMVVGQFSPRRNWRKKMRRRKKRRQGKEEVEEKKKLSVYGREMAVERRRKEARRKTQWLKEEGKERYGSITGSLFSSPTLSQWGVKKRRLVVLMSGVLHGGNY